MWTDTKDYFLSFSLFLISFDFRSVLVAPQTTDSLQGRLSFCNYTSLYIFDATKPHLQKWCTSFQNNLFQNCWMKLIIHSQTHFYGPTVEIW